MAKIINNEGTEVFSLSKTELTSSNYNILNTSSFNIFEPPGNLSFNSSSLLFSPIDTIENRTFINTGTGTCSLIIEPNRNEIETDKEEFVLIPNQSESVQFIVNTPALVNEYTNIFDPIPMFNIKMNNVSNNKNLPYEYIKEKNIEVGNKPYIAYSLRLDTTTYDWFGTEEELGRVSRYTFTTRDKDWLQGTSLNYNFQDEIIKVPYYTDMGLISENYVPDTKFPFNTVPHGMYYINEIKTYIHPTHWFENNPNDRYEIGIQFIDNENFFILWEIYAPEELKSNNIRRANPETIYRYNINEEKYDSNEFIRNYRWADSPRGINLPPGNNYFRNPCQIPGIKFLITPNVYNKEENKFFYIKVYTYINNKEIFAKRFKCETFNTHR